MIHLLLHQNYNKQLRPVCLVPAGGSLDGLLNGPSVVASLLQKQLPLPSPAPLVWRVFAATSSTMFCRGITLSQNRLDICGKTAQKRYRCCTNTVPFTFFKRDFLRGVSYRHARGRGGLTIETMSLTFTFPQTILHSRYETVLNCPVDTYIQTVLIFSQKKQITFYEISKALGCLFVGRSNTVRT